MNKIMTASMAFAFAIFMGMSASVYADNQNVDTSQMHFNNNRSNSGNQAYSENQTGQVKVDKSAADVKNLIGKDVKDQQGKKLGSVKDFLSDSEGRITVAVVSSGGIWGAGAKEVGVPFDAIHYDQNKGFFTTDLTKNKLAQAPAFKANQSMNVDDYSNQVYGYYGMQPAWQKGQAKQQQTPQQQQQKAQEQQNEQNQQH